jgi:hypothetical protein
MLATARAGPVVVDNRRGESWGWAGPAGLPVSGLVRFGSAAGRPRAGVAAARAPSVRSARTTRAPIGTRSVRRLRRRKGWTAGGRRGGCGRGGLGPVRRSPARSHRSAHPRSQTSGGSAPFAVVSVGHGYWRSGTRSPSPTRWPTTGSWPPSDPSSCRSTSAWPGSMRPWPSPLRSRSLVN